MDDTIYAMEPFIPVSSPTAGKFNVHDMLKPAGLERPALLRLEIDAQMNGFDWLATLPMAGGYVKGKQTSLSKSPSVQSQEWDWTGRERISLHNPE